jgi:DNA-binding transcriptional LysR family regulator
LDFDLMDLRLFVNVVDTLSLTRGAQRSHISIPAASARIKKVEEALATRLFYRTTQGLVPTSAGQIFLTHARIVLQNVQQMTDALRSDTGSLRGEIRLYANTLSISEFVTPALQRFLMDFPEVNIDLHERTSGEILRAVKSGAADIGILSTDQEGCDLTFLPYRTEQLVVITPLGHPLAQAQPARFASTLTSDYIGLKENTALQAFTTRVAAADGAVLKTRIRADTFEALCQLVSSGVGLGLIPRAVAERQAKLLPLCIVALQDGWAVRELKIGVRDLQSLSPQARMLIQVLAP